MAKNWVNYKMGFSGQIETPVSRISSMVENLCTEWGESLACYQGKEYFAFPPIEKLAEEGVEGRLRELGFGYRAKYIQQSAARFDQPNRLCILAQH